jgi:hypothetical protein
MYDGQEARTKDPTKAVSNRDEILKRTYVTTPGMKEINRMEMLKR